MSCHRETALLHAKVVEALQTIYDHHRVKGDHWRAEKVRRFAKQFFGVELKP